MTLIADGHLRKLVLGAGVFLACATASYSQSSGGIYEVRAHALDSGGRSTGGVYAVQSVLGQATTTLSNGGVFSASTGLLRQRDPLPDAIFANGFE